MSKKILFATIPMLDSSSLKQITYRKESDGKLYSSPASFPSIPMIEWAVSGNDDIRIVAVMTEDKTNRSEKNLELFKSQLKQLGEEMGFVLSVNDILTLPHNESPDKQIELFSKIIAFYDDSSEIHMDLTYGTKMTTIGLFASLVYAEKAMKCEIKSLVYGKYAHDGSSVGEIYDMKCLYDLNMIINSANYMTAEGIKNIIDSLLGG